MQYHDHTNHTYESVRIPGFLDWDTQPTSFKRYPNFYHRIPFDSLPEKDFWPLLGGITEQRQHGDARYSLRTIPSAGALFPLELYLQIRNIPGMLDGIYHYEAITASLVLLHPVERDGVEPWLGMNKLSGILFLISSPWFRSEWKYGLRSFRYCNLDTGHQLGAIEAACAAINRPFAILTHFDKKNLASWFGMEDKEFMMAAAVSGEEGEKEVKRLSVKLPHVLPTDYHIPSDQITKAYEETLYATVLPGIPVYSPPYNQNGLQETILTRRSVRVFSGEEMNKEELEHVMHLMTAPFPCSNNPTIDFYAIVNPRVKGMISGLYKNGILQKEGNFSLQAKYLLLEQKLGGDSGATLFLTGKNNDYQTLMMKAGLMGHRLYLEAGRLGLGASGIGAYYDIDTQGFLETDDWILYALVVGR